MSGHIPAAAASASARPAGAQQVRAWRVDCRGPADLGGVQALIDAGEVVPAEIVAVMGKTEGNGCVNDYTRELASQAWCHLLAPLLGCSPAQVHQRVALVMSGGTEGVLSPHFTVFTRRQVDAAQARPGKRLVLGIAHTRDFLPQEIGRGAQIEATAAAVRANVGMYVPDKSVMYRAERTLGGMGAASGSPSKLAAASAR